MLYSLDDIIIIPETFSDIEHRSECKIEDKDNKLPLFAAPMSCVINMDNYKTFEDIGIRTIIPRNIPLTIRLELSHKVFAALSLNEFEEYVANLDLRIKVTAYICVDVANGHMKKLYDLARKAKKFHGNKLVLMIGNIANPSTYDAYASIGVDYVRLGIGTGNVCTTSANVGLHFPLASLIDECYKTKLVHHYKTKMVADGGFKNFDQINKALALGADYVMLGQILAKSEEACGEKTFGGISEDGTFIKFNPDLGIGGCYCREYYGMSTKRAQKEFGKEGNTTAEGIVKWVEVEYPISKWIDNFKHYLRSAMSYTNSRTLEEFKGSRWDVQTPTGRMSYYK